MSDFPLVLPELEINLYEDGFKGVCQLGRAEEGEKLSNLIERFSQPLVVALDAPWGAGKSVFLKCWVGAHEAENGGSAKTVYFDAFKHDFMDDPLIGLTGVISERVATKGTKARYWKQAKEAAPKLARSVARVGLAIATSGITEVAKPIVDSGLEAGSKELEKASEEFWKKEDGKRAAMQGFREALTNLAAEQKLVIVVDELDRCRPDYALSLLEVIKHFFDVPNVHFVLGVNLRELANSVRARYGARIQADRYLQKFVTITMPLVPRKARSASTQIQIRHFESVSRNIGLFDSWKYDWLKDYFRYIDHHAGLSLRDVEKIATLAMVTPDPGDRPSAKLHLYIGILILQVLAPETVEKARLGIASDEDIFSVFRLKQRPPDQFPDREAHSVWWLIANRQSSSIPNYLDEATSEFFADIKPRDLLREVIAETLDVFHVMK